ncbi:MAG: Ig-like domain-containing protein [bacterium]
MKQQRSAQLSACFFLGLLSFSPVASAQTNWHVLGWNNLGMHCMDNDFSVFSILPPYNTIHAQLIWSANNTAHLIQTGAGYSVSCAAIADPAGSINKTSIGKGNFWTYVPLLLGQTLPPDAGVDLSKAGYPQSFMPGTNNLPKPMNYETNSVWFASYGIPITPYDDLMRKNPYPMMRLSVSKGNVQVATTDIVLPVSDEMDCRICHASGSDPAAMPPAGWVWEPSPTRDYRLNILRLHDARQFQKMPTNYPVILAASAFTTNGLYASVVKNGKPVFCAACHLSEAVPGTGYPGVPPLTTAVHGLHATVTDPTTLLTLDANNNRSACYRCHPGSETRCLRGVMGTAVAANGTLAMQCQSCHGSMSVVGSPSRTGWLNEPTCQTCHSGDAVSNNGQIRYTSSFTNGVYRVAVNQRFATNTNAPAAGLTLYRFSRGHGGLYCSACHGSTHAEYPSAFTNDNVASIQFQGHEGVISECTHCHRSNPSTVSGGPHGLHPLGVQWVVDGHKDPGKSTANCAPCHGVDQRGTVLSRSQMNWSVSLFERRYIYNFWRGQQIGCYTCHMGYGGPNNSTDPNPNLAPVAQNVSASTGINMPVAFLLHVTDDNADPLTYRIVKQAAHGHVGLVGSTATYYPDTAFAGTDTFTFAAWDGSTDSNLGGATVTVGGGACSYVISPSSQAFSELSQVGSVQVTTGTWSGPGRTTTRPWRRKSPMSPHAQENTRCVLSNSTLPVW